MSTRMRTSRRPEIEALEDRRLLSGPGSLDTTFGSGGIVATTDHPTAVMLRQDGKILTAGWMSDKKGSKVSLARYDASGRPDSSFGSGGKVVSTALGEVDAAALYPDAGTAQDGKIVAVDFNYNLARFKPDGSLDATFGKKGVATTAFPPGTWWPASTSIVVQPDGKVLASGWISDPAGTGANHIVFALARYNVNGTLDATFGSGGFARVIAGPGDSWINDMALQPDGRIVVAGAVGLTPRGAPADTSFAVARLNANGTLDTSFGPSGTGVAALGRGEARAVALQPDGRIVVAGQKNTIYDPSFQWMAARFSTNGILDPSFGGGGTAIGPDGWINDAAMQPDGSIVAGGIVGASAGLARYTASGQLDPGFGSGGMVLTSLSGAGHSSVTLQPNGSILTTGRKNGYETTSQYLARYLGGTAPAGAALGAPTGTTQGVGILDDAVLGVVPEGSASSRGMTRRPSPTFTPRLS